MYITNQYKVIDKKANKIKQMKPNEMSNQKD